MKTPKTPLDSTRDCEIRTFGHTQIDGGRPREHHSTYDVRRTTMPTMPTTALSEAEAEVYDRQIRVWGVETQQRLRQAHVLVVLAATGGDGSASADDRREVTTTSIGTHGLAAETLKNIVLAGVGRVRVRDDGKHASTHTFGNDGNFLNIDATEGTSLALAMVRTLEEMNPFATIEAESEVTMALTDETVEYYTQFDVVVACGFDYVSSVKINAACRAAKCGFFVARASAASSSFFVDLGDTFDYIGTGGSVAKDGEAAAPPPTCTETFCAIDDAAQMSWENFGKRASRLPAAMTVLWEFEKRENRAATDEDFERLRADANARAAAYGKPENFIADDALRVLLQAKMEIPAINAIVGGVLAQEVLKAVSHKGAPCANFFVFDCVSGQGVQQRLSA